MLHSITICAKAFQHINAGNECRARDSVLYSYTNRDIYMNSGWVVVDEDAIVSRSVVHTYTARTHTRSERVGLISLKLYVLEFHCIQASNGLQCNEHVRFPNVLHDARCQRLRLIVTLLSQVKGILLHWNARLHVHSLVCLLIRLLAHSFVRNVNNIYWISRKQW